MKIPLPFSRGGDHNRPDWSVAELLRAVVEDVCELWYTKAAKRLKADC